jgi:hypothetical protein
MTMTASDLDDALAMASAEGLVPLIFKVLCRPDGPRPACAAKRGGIAIDPIRGNAVSWSYLLCWGGVKIRIEGEWA